MKPHNNYDGQGVTVDGQQPIEEFATIGAGNPRFDFYSKLRQKRLLGATMAVAMASALSREIIST
ncbi:MAG: hypothetical protein IH600_07455 [Bacteroidetes bacterium]|nr:hypothetical protein [Bacteroidota bacterium]